MATETVLERKFEDGTAYELLEFLNEAEEIYAPHTAYVEANWVGGHGPKLRAARLLCTKDEDGHDYEIEITDKNRW